MEHFLHSVALAYVTNLFKSPLLTDTYEGIIVAIFFFILMYRFYT